MEATQDGWPRTPDQSHSWISSRDSSRAVCPIPSAAAGRTARNRSPIPGSDRQTRQEPTQPDDSPRTTQPSSSTTCSGMFLRNGMSFFGAGDAAVFQVTQRLSPRKGSRHSRHGPSLQAVLPITPRRSGCRGYCHGAPRRGPILAMGPGLRSRTEINWPGGSNWASRAGGVTKRSFPERRRYGGRPFGGRPTTDRNAPSRPVAFGRTASCGPRALRSR
jgi:hypothetical protein